MLFNPRGHSEGPLNFLSTLYAALIQLDSELFLLEKDFFNIHKLTGFVRCFLGVLQSYS